MFLLLDVRPNLTRREAAVPAGRFDVVTARDWDARSYDKVGGPMTEMALAVLDRLELRGDETVLDAGCGTGRVSELLLERLPEGRVIAVDADPEMVAAARRNLADRAEVIEASLLDVALEDLGLDAPGDAIFSTATFHWILDHDALFGNLARLLVPGGRLVAQCGGVGNIADLRRAGDEVAALPEFAPYFDGWTVPWYYAEPDVTAERLDDAGFVEVRTWLQPWPVVPEDPAEYVATITFGAQVQRLPDELRDSYVAAVLERMTEPVTVDYVRLNIDARLA